MSRYMKMLDVRFFLLKSSAKNNNIFVAMFGTNSNHSEICFDVVCVFCCFL